ncbi:Bifunctional inhibitor/lipid-transfer protein/seed storage 2S albumin superfamily protein [Striga hermonthica]|uniref:Bifunctional inhibitor/lipid-transfer protein/seed storage 2S albumin superfamily protein n=1 Tax=Striga hermonthica TaxID=68872 RepID=A0A9N7RIR3_STRHE|nr:Bifunctional inhibitor/lipid-transfer protein/seed storage 2S albumin superfamily protein [Striga hermonthica]
MAFSSTIAVILTAAVLVAAAGVAEAQMDCAAQLMPCVPYLNSTRPSAECCNAIRQVVSTQLHCLCSLYKNPAALPGINITQALMVPTHCNIPTDVSACSALAPTGSSHTPPGVSGSDGNGASTMTSWMAMPALLLLLAFTYLH